MNKAYLQHQEWISRIKQTMADDLVRNGMLAENILAQFTRLRGNADRSHLLEDRDHIRSEWVRISASQLTTTHLVRQVSLFTISEPELRTYLYATQYLFLGETYFLFCVDLVTFFCEIMRGSASSWTEFEEQSAGKSLFAKLAQLEKDGIDYFSKMYDRPLRNSLAHGNFEVTKDGHFRCWMRADQSDIRELSIDDLIKAFDQISDVTMIVSFIFSRGMTSEFLGGKSLT